MKKFVLTLCAAVLALAGCSHTPERRRFETLVFPPLEKTACPDYTKVTLDNGMTVLLMEDDSLPLVSFSALVRAGAIWDPPEKSGLAEMTLEVMRTGGAGDLTGQDIDETLEHIGARISASAGRDASTVEGISDTENFPGVFSIFASIVKSPRFEQDRVELSRINKNAAISRREDDISSLAGMEFRQLVYGRQNPYAAVYGHETVNAVTREDMEAFHRNRFHPENIILGVWGAFETDSMLETIRETFGAWQAEETACAGRLNIPEPEIAPASFNVIRKPESTQSVIMAGHAGMRRDHPDHFTALVISRVLGIGWHSRFSRKIRQEKGLAYSAWAGFFSDFGYPGMFYGKAQTRSGRTMETLGLMKEEIRLILEGATETELETARESIINSEVFWSDTTDKVMARLLRYQYYGYPEDYPQKLLEEVSKVTACDFKRVASEHIFPENLTVLIVGNAAEFDLPLPPEADILR